MEKKSYKITFALQEGYSPDNRLHPVADAAGIICDWMTARLKAGQPVVSGLLQEGQLFFPATAGSGELVTVSPTAVYYGELSSPGEMKRPDKEIRATLESLALALKTGLNQESVFITYRHSHWCV